jgi:serine/threonine protein kinase
MTPERWQKVKEILNQALPLAADARAAWLERACAGDEVLRGEVEELLAAHQTEFLEKPAIGEMADALAGASEQLSGGQRLSHYQILKSLGAGGMGEVFLAEDTKLKRKVALKLLPAEFTDDPQRLKRFEQEARAASALNHPNIITIYEIGAADGKNYIAAEFIEGPTLRQKMRGQLLPLAETLEIAAQTAAALVAAHEAGLVHRDIKPENIMIRPDGLVKALDFGLAKHSRTASHSEADTLAHGLTTPGMILGTLQYMSPEQARGLKLDARSDIFSLGAVLYEMLAGAPPFAKPTKSDVIAAILTEDPPPLVNQRPETPAELQRIVTKALQKKPDERYQSSRDLLLDLKALARELEFTAKLNRAGRAAPLNNPATTGEARALPTGAAFTRTANIATAPRFSLVQALAALLGAVLVIGAVWRLVFKRDNVTETPAPATLKTAEVVSWSSSPGEVYSIGSFSPDGKMVAFASTKAGGKNIWFKQATSGEAVQVTKDEFRNDYPIWSPNGEEIAYLSLSRGEKPGLWRIPYTGGAPKFIATPPDGAAFLRYWSKRDVIYYEAQNNLFAFDAKTGRPAQLTNFDAQAGVSAINISPDEQRIAYVAAPDGRWSVWTAAANGGAAQRLVTGPDEIRNVVWHPDNQRILYSSKIDGTFQIFVTDIEGRPPAQITFADKDSLALDVAADGAKILFGASKEESDVWGVNLAGPKEFPLASDSGSELWPNAAPDGQTVAYQAVNNLSQGDKLLGSAILAKQTQPDAQPQQLAANGFLPTWSPDGKQLAFMRVEGEAFSLWRVNAGGGEEKQLATGGIPPAEYTLLPYKLMQVANFTWSPDSRRLAYVSTRSGSSNVWLVNADGSQNSQLTDNDDANLQIACPLWSLDSKRMAYSSKPNRVPAEEKLIYATSTFDLETKRVAPVFQSETFHKLLGWSYLDKDLILAASNLKSAKASPLEVSILRVNTETGRQRSIAKLEAAYLYNIHLSTDGKMIAFVSSQDGNDNVWMMPANGGPARKLTNNNNPRLYFSSLAWSPDNRAVYFGKQSRYSLLSLITNFK